MAWSVIGGDCLEVLPELEPDSIPACVTDPPYGLSFMGKNWDHGVPGPAYWEAVKRVLKPGAPLLAFGGTRTHHRLMTAIEDAGFEIRDCLMWLYGQGFPKSHNISKAIDKAAGAEREVVGVDPCAAKRNKTTSKFSNLYGSINDKMSCPITAPATDEAKLWDGWGSALKPSFEPILLAMKPLDGTFANNALTHGVAGLNIDGCRIGSESRVNGPASTSRVETMGRPNHSGSEWNEDHPASQVTGRWPANVVLDEEAARLLDEQSGVTKSNMRPPTFRDDRGVPGFTMRRHDTKERGHHDTGGASRFFYTSKASRAERTANGSIANGHPTVKPVKLMRWLVRLASPPTNRLILDPFAGSGSTGVAAIEEGASFLGIEIDSNYSDLCKQRLRHAWKEARRDSSKRGKDQEHD